MAWLWVVLVVVVLGVTASVAVGRGGSLGRAYPDRRDVRLPADRPVTAHDLNDVRFSVVLRGYRMDEVDDLLVRLTQELAARDARLAGLASGGTGGEESAPRDALPPPGAAPPSSSPATTPSPHSSPSDYAPARPPADAPPPPYASVRAPDPDDSFARHSGDTPAARPGAGDP